MVTHTPIQKLTLHAFASQGKGKLVDILAQDVQLCARFNGGANAGHTLRP